MFPVRILDTIARALLPVAIAVALIAVSGEFDEPVLLALVAATAVLTAVLAYAFRTPMSPPHPPENGDSMTPKLFGVMRHAQAFHQGDDEERQSLTYPALTCEGVRATRAVGARFEDFLAQTEPRETVVVYDVGTPETRATADLLSVALGHRATRATTSLSALSPFAIPTYRTAYGKKLAAALENALDCSQSMVIVAHDPQATWMSRVGLRRRALPLSLSSSEMIWRERPQRRGQRWDGDSHFRRNIDLEWVFSPSDDAALKEVREKITSKMDSAKVLGTFLTALFALAARQVLEQVVGDGSTRPTSADVLAVVGLCVLALSIILFFVSLYRYDSLLMPTRFWSSRPGRPRRGLIRRPPASSVMVLAQGMIRTWDRLFTPAVWAAGIGIGMLALSLAEPEGVAEWTVAAVIGILLAAIALAFARWSRPGIGTND